MQCPFIRHLMIPLPPTVSGGIFKNRKKEELKKKALLVIYKRSLSLLPALTSVNSC